MPSASPPEYFIDRSLGRHIVPDALREAGAVVHVMAEVYGERVGQGLADTEWLRDVGAQGWVVLMKDDRIRYRPAELEALTASAVRAFCLTNANLRGTEMAERFRRPAPPDWPDRQRATGPVRLRRLRRWRPPALAPVSGDAGSQPQKIAVGSRSSSSSRAVTSAVGVTPS